MSGKQPLKENNDVQSIVIVHACNLCTQEAEADGLIKFRSQPGLYNELQISHGYIVRLEYGKQKQKQKQNKMNMMIIKYKSIL